MKTLKASCLFLFAIVLLVVVSCKNNSVIQEQPEEGGTEITDTVDVTIPADSGEVGLVINTRNIFRKGYTPTEAEVAFPDYSSFNKTLKIDPVTSVSVLHISNEDLSKEEQDAFAAGIATDITIYDDNQTMLAENHYDEQVLDDSGIPLNITNDNLDYKIPPLKVTEGIPYYVVPKEINGEGTFIDGGALKASTEVLYTFKIPDFNISNYTYDYYFTPVGDGSGTYYIQRGDPNAGPRWYFTHKISNTADPTAIDVTENVADAIKFELEQTADGWIRIREGGTEKYLTITEGSNKDDRKALRMETGTHDLFRFVNAGIKWTATDQGTVYNNPVMPPAKVNFAYQATIRNCTQGTLTEEVGVSKTQTSTQDITTSESIQLSNQHEAGVELGVSAALGGEIYGAKVTVNASAHYTFTHQKTTTKDTTINTSDSQTTEVSRKRTIEVIPNTAVEVYDAVRVVSDAYVPFTQVVRLTAKYDNGFGDSLTGDEIMSQMLMNRITGVPVKVGDDYVDIGMTGSIKVNDMYSTETGANEIPNACN